MTLSTDRPVASSDVAAPAYTSAEARAPRYAPKKDFAKTFADFQGQFGCESSGRLSYICLLTRLCVTVDGIDPIIFNDDKKPSAPQQSGDRSDSTDPNTSFAKSFIRSIFRSRTPPKQSSGSAYVALPLNARWKTHLILVSSLRSSCVKYSTKPVTMSNSRTTPRSCEEMISRR